MKVLLISTNRERTPYPVLPVGPCLVAARLEEEGFAVEVADLMWEDDPPRAAAAAVARAAPDVIGVSMRNIDNSDLIETKYFVPDAAELFAALRRATPAPVVLGGAAAAIEPVRLFRALAPDAILYGDAEDRFPVWLRARERGEPCLDLPGLVVEHEGRLIHNPLHSTEPIDGLPDAALFRYVDMPRYMRREGVYPIQTKRGCGFTCTYCTYGTLEGIRYRFRPPAAVVEEIERAHAAGATFFEFVDAVFSHPPIQARGVLNGILNRRLPVKLTAAGFNPVGVTEDLVALMRRAGFIATTCTVESASDAVLERMQKGFRREAVSRLAIWLPRNGIPAVWVFLVGSPGETRDTVAETFEFIDREIPRRDLVYITHGVRVYPGTGLERRLRADGLIGPAANLLEPFFYLSPDLPRDWYFDYLEGFARQHANVVHSFEAQQPIVDRLTRACMYLPLPKPRWRVLPYLRRFVDPFQPMRRNLLDDHPFPVVPAAGARIPAAAGR